MSVRLLSVGSKYPRFISSIRSLPSKSGFLRRLTLIECKLSIVFDWYFFFVKISRSPYDFITIIIVGCK